MDVPTYKWIPLTYQLSSRLGARPGASIDATNPSQQDLLSMPSQLSPSLSQSGRRSPNGPNGTSQRSHSLLSATSSSSQHYSGGGGLGQGVSAATFAQNLELLLWRLCTEHPHHSLLQVTFDFILNLDFRNNHCPVELPHTAPLSCTSRATPMVLSHLIPALVYFLHYTPSPHHTPHISHHHTITPSPHRRTAAALRAQKRRERGRQDQS